MAYHRYTEAEDRFIAQHIQNFTYQQIADKLGVSKISVERRARKLGLRRGERQDSFPLMDRKSPKAYEAAVQVHKQAILQKAEEYRRAGGLDLDSELAQMRALRDVALDWVSGREASRENIEFLMRSVEKVAAMVDRISNMLNKTALTQAEVQFLQKHILDVITRYVPKDQRDACLREIAEGFGVRGRSAGAG